MQQQQIVLPKTTMRHTRASALRYQKQLGANSVRPQRRSQQQQQFSQSAPLSGATVLDLHEFGHIARLATKSKFTNYDKMKKDALRERSRARAKHWGNTIEALRDKKIQDRVARMAEVERRQQIVDDQEAAYQEQQRRNIIDRANSLLWSQNERVANFHSGLQYASVIKEREAQIRMKKRVKDKEAEEERYWFELEKKQMSEYDRREEEKRQQRIAIQMQKKEDQRLQLQQWKERARRERLAEIQEGQLVREYAAQAKEHLREQELAKKRKAQSIARGYIQSNEEQKLLKLAAIAMDREHDEKLMAYALEKERIAEERKAVEAKQLADKQAFQAVLVERQFQDLEALQKQSEVKLLRDAQDLEAKTLANLAREEARRKQEQAATHASRQQQLRSRKLKVQREKEEEELYLQMGIRRRAEMDAIEAENERKTIEKNKRHQQALLNQSRAKAEKFLRERRDSLDRHAELQAHDARDEIILNNYMASHLERAQKMGLSTKPMELIVARDKSRQVALH